MPMQNKEKLVRGIWACLFLSILLYAEPSKAKPDDIENNILLENKETKTNFYNSILNQQERLWLQVHKKIRLGVDPAWPPFEYLDQNSAYSGVASGYINIIKDMLGIEIAPIENIPWSAVVTKAKNRQIDVLPAVGITPERRKYLNFTQAYISFPTVIATRDDEQFVGNLNDLVNMKVGVVENYVTHENIMHDFPELTIVPLKTLDIALNALSNNKIDAFVDNLAAITYGINKLQIDNIKIAAPTKYTFELHMGVRKDWQELVTILNKAINNIPEAKRSSIQNEWVSIYVNFGIRIKTIALWLTPVLATFLILLFIWNRRLKSEIKERLVTEIELKKLSTAIEQSPVSILISDPEGYIEYSNPRFEEVSGYSLKELKQSNTRLFNSGQLYQKSKDTIWKTVSSGEIWTGEVQNKRKGGEYYWEYTSICPIKNKNNEIINYVAVKEDITQRKNDEILIHKQATTDSLTGLSNRMLFLDRLSQEITHCKRSGDSLAVIFIDLDRFKNINDTKGHSVGDLLLIEIGKRLSSCLRDSDTVARFGGDEFIVLIRNIKSSSDLEIITKKFQERLARPILIKDIELYISCSIGIALYPEDGKNSETLILHADMAMYRAKELGRNNYHFYSESLHVKAVAQAELGLELRNAIIREEFMVFYQPIFSLVTMKIEKVEALLRWNHPDKGILTPDKFISIAEETRLIVEIGSYVLKQACKDFKGFLSSSVFINDLSVNCSPEQFQNKDFEKMVKQTIIESGISADQVTLEITENLFINAEDSKAVSTLVNLREAGIKIALDDFGTGYSSLGYLRRFPVDTIKIDRSFIRDIVEDPNDYRLVDTIIRMGHALDLTVIAEGIESSETASLVKDLNCEYAQGYFYGHPLPKQDFIKLLNIKSRESKLNTKAITGIL